MADQEIMARDRMAAILRAIIRDIDGSETDRAIRCANECMKVTAALRARLDAAEARAARLAEALAPVASEIADAADTDTRWEQVHHALADADSGWLAEHDASVRRAVLAEVVSSPQLRIEAAKAIARHLAQFEHDILYGTAARSHDDAKEGEK